MTIHYRSIHFYLLTLSLAICFFLYFDAYFVTVNVSRETVTGKYFSISGSESNKQRTYELETNGRSYEITQALYNATNTANTVDINRSTITNAIQTITVHSNKSAKKYPVGFVNAWSGRFFTPLIILCIIVFVLYYNRTAFLQKERLAVLLFINTLYLSGYYLYVYAG